MEWNSGMEYWNGILEWWNASEGIPYRDHPAHSACVSRFSGLMEWESKI